MGELGTLIFMQAYNLAGCIAILMKLLLL